MKALNFVITRNKTNFSANVLICDAVCQVKMLLYTFELFHKYKISEGLVLQRYATVHTKITSYVLPIYKFLVRFYQDCSFLFYIT